MEGLRMFLNNPLNFVPSQPRKIIMSGPKAPPVVPLPVTAATARPPAKAQPAVPPLIAGNALPIYIGGA